MRDRTRPPLTRSRPFDLDSRVRYDGPVDGDSVIRVVMVELIRRGVHADLSALRRAREPAGWLVWLMSPGSGEPPAGGWRHG